MQLTPIGIAVIVLLLGTAIIRPTRLWVLLILVTPFQAAALLTFAGTGRDTGVNPTFLVMAMASVVEIASAIHERRQLRPLVKLTTPVLLFLLWAVAGAFFIPRLLFADVRVLHYGALGPAFLGPVPSNGRHAAYLVVCVVGCCALAHAVSRLPDTFTVSLLKATKTAGAIAAVLIVWHMFALYAGAPFPDKLLYSNPGVAQNQGGMIRPELGIDWSIRRPAGSFSEPSYAAMYMCGFFAFVLGRYVYGNGSVLRLSACVILAALIIAIASSTGIVALVGVLGVVGLQALSAAGTSGKPVASRLCFVIIITLSGSALVLLASDRLRADVSQAARYLIFERLDQESRISSGRFSTEVNAYEVFLDTCGIGAGLGSNVSLTLPGYVLSNTGIIGAVLLLWFALRLIRRVRSALRAMPDRARVDLRSVYLSNVALILTGLVSVPLLLQPTLWIATGLLIGLSLRSSGARDLRVRFGAKVTPAAFAFRLTAKTSGVGNYLAPRV